MSDSRVTIVVVPRERFSLTELSLERLYAQTPLPFKLVYVDGGSPARVKRYLETQARERGFQLIRTDHYLAPNEARNLGLRSVDTRFVVFLDNDVLVSPGWLEALVRCAEDHADAWVVGSVYCIDAPQGEIPHRVGGNVAGRQSSEPHSMPQQGPCEFVEFRGMLVCTEVFQWFGALDESLLSGREHIDFCMRVREVGGSIYVEPHSVVTVPTRPLTWSDLPYFLLRYSDEWCRRTLHRFRYKWELHDHDPDLVAQREWFERHRRRAFKQLDGAASRTLGRLLGASGKDAVLCSIEPVLTRWAVRYAVHRRRREAVRVETHREHRPLFSGISKGGRDRA
jgi:GT2 family glycosyltransferase